MSQLTVAIESPPELIVAKSRLQVKVSALAHTYLEFVFSARVGNYLPVVDAFVEALIGDHSPE